VLVVLGKMVRANVRKEKDKRRREKGEEKEQ
jgi:hypothetical protein